MSTLVAFQAVALVLLAVLVVGLLRTHAEIVRTLHRLGAGIGDEAGPGTGAAAGAQALTLGRTRAVPTATASTGVDLAGTTPEGEPVELAVRDAGADTLVAFLSSTCSTCTEFWRALRRPAADLGLPEGTRLVVVTKDAGEEDQARIRHLAPPAHPVVMSSASWQAYGVPVTPYFLHVDGATGEIVGQGSGHSWEQVASLLGRAVGDAATAAGGARRRVAESEADIDRRLLAAGITPGDPRLYPGPEPEE
ncbi:MAG: TlpA family protein disulfide reductase [Acidimicrobiia bacterium]